MTRSSSAGTVSARSRAQRRTESLGPETQAVHARVHLDPDDEAFGAAMRLEQFELQRVVHHQLEAMMRGLGELLGAEHAFEQHDGRTHAGAAQRDALFQSRHREAVGIGQRQRGEHQSVAIGIGLDDRHDFRARCIGADGAEVVP